MNKAARRYLRQVKRQLICRYSIKGEHLRQWKDEVLLYSESQPEIDYPLLVERFGRPEEVAASYFEESDSKVITHFAYTRLRAAYLIFTVVLLAAFSLITASAIDYVETQQLVSGAREASTFIHPSGTECSEFWVRTNFRGQDIYWSYHSCIGRMVLSGRPKNWDNEEPYAVDIYLNKQGNIEHWTFGQKHRDWIRVYDVE